MRTVSRSINVYEYDDLTEEVRQKVINEYIQFLIETTDFSELYHNSNMYKAYRKSEEMQTPWFLGNYIWDYCHMQIEESVREWEHYEDGRVFNESDFN